jgi:hypothetical protein
MKYLKMLGLLAVAAAALMAFAGTAAATTATSPKGTAYTGTYKAVAGLTQLHGPFVTVACGSSTVEGKIEQHGTGVTTKGPITYLNFTECNYSVTVIKSGSLEAHATAVKGTDADGTVTSTGFEVRIHTSVGECIFTTSGTDIGTGSLTSTTTTGGNAVLDVKSASIPRTGGSFFCGSSGTWTGSYKVVTPSTLYIDA